MATQTERQDFWHQVTRQIESQESLSGTKMTQVQIAAVQANGKASVKRIGENASNGIAWPVVNPAYKPVNGDWVWALQTNNGDLVILGRNSTAGDVGIKELSTDVTSLSTASTAIKPPAGGGQQRIDKGTQGSNADRVHMELYKDFGSGILETAMRFHQSGRYWYRIAADHHGIHIKDGNPDFHNYHSLTAFDVWTENGINLKSRLANGPGSVGLFHINGEMIGPIPENFGVRRVGWINAYVISGGDRRVEAAPAGHWHRHTYTWRDYCPDGKWSCQYSATADTTYP